MASSLTIPRPKVEPRTDVDPVFNAVLKSLQEQAADAAEARVTGKPVKWMMPPESDWSKDLKDTETLATAFAPETVISQFVDGTTDPEKPGSTGDLVVTQAQVDYLAVMERAFRVRHMPRLRLVCHAACRAKRHGDDKGPLIGGVLEYVRSLVTENKKGQG